MILQIKKCLNKNESQSYRSTDILTDCVIKKMVHVQVRRCMIQNLFGLGFVFVIEFGSFIRV